MHTDFLPFCQVIKDMSTSNILRSILEVLNWNCVGIKHYERFGYLYYEDRKLPLQYIPPHLTPPLSSVRTCFMSLVLISGKK